MQYGRFALMQLQSDVDGSEIPEVDEAVASGEKSASASSQDAAAVAQPPPPLGPCARRSRGKVAASIPTDVALLAELKKEYKRCNTCGKHQLLIQYNQSQAKCKSCNNDARSLLRIAETQKCRPEITKAKDNEKEFSSLCKAFSRARAVAAKSGENSSSTCGASSWNIGAERDSAKRI